ncbi:hypothetical protein [Hydrogeniiclostridium mannosilyticum]
MKRNACRMDWTCRPVTSALCMGRMCRARFLSRPHADGSYQRV